MNKHVFLGGLMVAAVLPALAAAQPEPAAGGYGHDAAYTSIDPWTGAPSDIQGRETWLARNIHTAMSAGAMNIDQGRSALKELGHIRETDAAYHAAGPLNDEQTADLQARLDAVHATYVKAVTHNSVRSF